MLMLKAEPPASVHSGLPKHGNVLLGPARVAHQAHLSRDFVTVTVSTKGLSMKLIAGILSHPVDIKSRAPGLHSGLPKHNNVLQVRPVWPIRLTGAETSSWSLLARRDYP
jgi:hypothetical protein